MSTSFYRNFPSQLEGRRAYAEAAEEHIYGGERQRARLHIAELERREEESRRREEREENLYIEEVQDSESLTGLYESSDISVEDESEDHDSIGSSSNSQRMSLYERTLCYAWYVQQFGLSNEEIKHLEELFSIMIGGPIPITYEGNVLALNKSILNEYDHKKYFFCTECGETMGENQIACRKPECKISGVPIKRAKRIQRTEVHLVNIIPQITDILVAGLEDIIAMHRTLRDNRMQGVAIEDRSDVRLFEGYYDSIESQSDFINRRVTVLLTMSLDGFVPRRLSKREVWPLYLCVEGLPPKEANNYFNTMIAGTVYTRLKPTESLIEVLFSRLYSELLSLHDTPLEVVVGEEVWTVDVRLFRGVADMPAQQALFGVPKWNADYGCSKCYIKGIRAGNQRIWIPSNNADLVERSEESFATDAEARQFGITKKTYMMDLLPPSHFLGDALHVCSEGITRNRLRDLFNPTSRFPELKVDRESLEHVKDCIAKITSHTYSNSLVLSLEDLPTCKGAEVDEMAFVLFPLVAAVDIVPSPIAAASLVGYWLCVRLICKTSSLTRTVIEKAKSIAEHTRDLWIMMSSQTFTMKCHFFEHAMERELERFGSLYQWSAAPFEGHHRRLQVKMNQHTTNSSTLLIERYLLGKKVRSLLSETDNIAFESLKKKTDNQKNRFPLEIRINERCYIPSNSQVCTEDLEEPEKTRILRSSDVPYTTMQRTSPYAVTRSRAAKRVYAKPRALLDITSPRVVEERAIPTEEVPIALEEEVPQGNVYERREFHVEERREQRPASPPLPYHLHDCITGGVLQVDTAAKLILAKMRRDEFNEAAYYEFVQSDVVARATTTYGSLNRPLGRDLDLLWGIANRITAEIARALATKNMRCYDTAERPLPCVTTKPSVNLLKECDDWSPRKKYTPYVQVSALYRHVLQRICNPPERIREYSLRINTLKGRDLKLKSLPRGITDTLIEMIEDMLGYGHEELEQFQQINLRESTYYQNLGSTEEERRQNLEDLKEEKKNWRPQLFKSLQLALRDVRSYTYEGGTWIANPRHKRGAPEGDENMVPSSQ